jgi:hypothetical protein
MVPRHQSVYTLVRWLALCLFAVGCGGSGDSTSPAGSSPGATQSQTDPEIPTVTLPDQDAGISGSSTSDEDSSQ